MNLGVPPLPTDPSVVELADWAELVTLSRGRLPRGKLSTEATRNGGTDILVADAWNELTQRAVLSGDHWTFTISVDQLEPRSASDEDNLLPAFFAALGLREQIQNPHRELFEQCVSELVLSLVPSALRLGHPRRDPVPSSFREAFKRYVDRIDEPLLALPPSTDNDLKMDVVAWLSLGDGRGGYIHLIGQCATGADWEEKLEELNLDVIADHVKWAVSPTRFFATPHVVPSQHFRRTSQRGGLILDRSRLLNLSRKRDLEPNTRAEVKHVLENLY